MMLLAPLAGDLPDTFRAVQVNCRKHEALLGEVQRIRGREYLKDGAIPAWQLSPEGRYIQAIDEKSWHLLVLNRFGQVAGCARYTPHQNGVSVYELGVAGSALAQSDHWGNRLHRAVESELNDARRRGISYAEVGGWAIAEELRCTTEALRMALTVWGLAQLLGGALGITTATTRHHSSSILRRIGGQPLVADGVELPPYYEAQYECEMEILRFDSRRPNPRYEAWVGDCRSNLAAIPVVCAEKGAAYWNRSVANLDHVHYMKDRVPADSVSN
jgi:hypothetical protein